MSIGAFLDPDCDRSMLNPPPLNSAARADRGLLIVGHGTEDARGRDEFARLVQQVSRRLPQAPVEGCFLELAAPDIATGLARLQKRGASDATVVPLLLFAAGHAKRDIPEQVAAALARLPGITVRQADCLNCAAPLVELSTLRCRAALSGRTEIPAVRTLLLMVGRGSHDDDATAEMRRFARLRGEQTPVARVETCFLAMARPTLEESLTEAARAPVARIVVQPHLLFAGKLADRIKEQVAGAAAGAPDIEFVLVNPLGPEELLVDAVLLRAANAPQAAPRASEQPI